MSPAIAAVERQADVPVPTLAGTVVLIEVDGVSESKSQFALFLVRLGMR